MQLKNINYAFIVYLALIEAFSLLALDIAAEVNFGIFNGFIVGFVPAFIVILIYRLTSDKYPVKINGKEVSKVPLLYISVVNGLFITLLFTIQSLLPNPDGLFGNALYGFMSVFFSLLILIAIYNKIKLKISFLLDTKLVKLKEIGLFLAVYAGVFEFFILPLMVLFYSLSVPPFFNGLLAGLIGATIALYIVDSILENKPVELSL